MAKQFDRVVDILLDKFDDFVEYRPIAGLAILGLIGSAGLAMVILAIASTIKVMMP